jgi:hypothetical protein
MSDAGDYPPFSFEGRNYGLIPQLSHTFPRSGTLLIKHRNKFGYVAHPASNTLSIGTISLKVTRQMRKAGHSEPSGAEVKSAGAVPPIVHMSSC